MRWLAALLLVLVASPARAGDCLARLADDHVAYRRAAQAGVELGVRLAGPLDGVALVGAPAVIDCSLAVSLDRAARYLRALGVSQVTLAPVRGGRGLAIDLVALAGTRFGAAVVTRDFERGLGDEIDCVGAPRTAPAEALKVIECQLVRSGLFSAVRSPDFDDAHRDRLELEVRPWSERTALRSPVPAMH
ncbi:MAG TPA: hypothetical protein VLX92_08230 [Kofleriaceae bacterium]|nr:hypothetical protein [Kofleriaceae bacterium]